MAETPSGHDAIVVGAGHNGLIAALRLARTGRRVAVVERREAPGGLCAAVEIAPGCRVPGLLHDDGRLPPKLADELGLAEHGLRFAEPPPVLIGEADGPGLLLPHAHEAAAAEIGTRSAEDADGYRRWRAFLARAARIVAVLQQEPPPPLSPDGLDDYWRLGRQGLALRRLGRRDMIELLRVGPMAVADWLREHFELAELAAGLAFPAVLGTWLGPWSAGSAANLLLHESLVDRSIVGGPAALIAALVRAATTQGIEIRCGVAVDEIRVDDGRAVGVALADGTSLDAPTVVSTCNPKQALLELVDPAALPLRLADGLRAVRARGTAAKVHLALDGPLEWRGRQGQAIAAARLGGDDLDTVERAFDAVKYGRCSSRPILDVRVPSLADRSPGEALAPDGHHVVSILVGYAPYELRAGWDDAAREALGDAVVEVLETYAPGVGEKIVARQVLTPADLAREHALNGGCLHHAEHALDQLLFMRPTAAVARYATPVGGLYLGGSGSHPGGGVTGLPGWLAGGAVLGS